MEVKKDLNVELGTECRFVSYGKVKAREKCKREDCPWEVVCLWSNKTSGFQIKTKVNNCTCSKAFRNTKAHRN